MIISITAQDIRRGKPAMPGICPVALAVKRAFRTSDIAISSFHIYKDGESAIYDLPEDAIDWILRFDEGKDCEPFNFELIGL